MLRFLQVLIFIALINVCTVCVNAEEIQTKGFSKSLPPLTGGVQENSYYGTSTSRDTTGYLKDSLTGEPIEGATVSVPDKGISTKSRADGGFKLDLPATQGNFILSVKKQGYLPFALNAKKDDFYNPFTLHLDQLQGQIVIDNNIHHLGDNNYSSRSANAASFQLPSEGPVFMKEFYVEDLPPKGMVLKIGTIVGLDTMASRELGQSTISAFSSPLSIFVNSIKIAEIAVNENNKEIPIYNGVLKPHSKNLLVFQTGVNQITAMSGTLDYDDFEFMNVFLELAK
ncbi:MAG: carboxypeptidase regulatory-like domain-containing protein [Vampirovibrionia bacterium]